MNELDLKEAGFIETTHEGRTGFYYFGENKTFCARINRDNGLPIFAELFLVCRVFYNKENENDPRNGKHLQRWLADISKKERLITCLKFYDE